jgi:exodeoxyribonuclease VII large subunit
VVNIDTTPKFTVSELTGLIRKQLEGAFGTVIVEGEVSNFRPSSTGHYYFTLKDSGAAISAMMFKNRQRFLRFEPRDGMVLRVKGSLSVYPKNGSYSIICEEMEIAGEGEILAMLEKRKRLLAAEGLFDESRKRPLPRFPGCVGVVSSPTGAAVRDILNVLGRRAAGVRVVILPAAVQGEGAEEMIARRIEEANKWKLCDVLIIGRGGGSLEDLLPFSAERVVRAAALSKIPVISAVGHEIDWALLDYAADLRAPTPSAAAELVSESREETLEYIRGIKESFYRFLVHRIERARLLVKPFSLEDLEYRFRAILQPRILRLDNAAEALTENLRERLTKLRQRLELSLTKIEERSPVAILERGFSLVINERTGKALRRAGELIKGDRLIIRPREGMIKAITEEIQN